MAFDLKKLLEDGVKTFGNAVGQGAQAVGNFFNKDVAQPVGNFVNNANKNFVQPAVNNTVKAVNTVSDNVNPLDQDFQHNVVKSIGDYFNPVADKVRVRDVVREIPSVVGKYVSGEGIYGNAQEAHQAAQDFNNWHGPKVGPDIFGKSLGEQVTDNIVKPAVNTFNTLGSMTEIVPKAIRGGIEQLSGQDGALAKRVATPYAFEATNNVGSARTGQDNTTLTPDETRKTVWAAAQAPLYMFSGAKGLGSTEGNLGARVLSRSTSVIPEAAINAAGQTYAEGDINKLPENMLTSYLTMAALSNATGGASDLTKGFINKVKSGEGIPVGLSIQDINKAFSNAKTPEAVQNIAQNAGVSLTKSQVNRLVKETDPTKINGILYPPTAAPVVPGETPVKTPEQMSLDMSGKPPVEPPVSTVPAGNPEKPFGFNNSAKGSEFVSPEAKAQLEGGNPTRSNIELQNTVAAKLDGMDAVKAHDFALKTNSDEGTAAAIQLAQQYRKSGQFDLEAQLINEKARRLREAGREVQAARLVDELSPEGTVANAANLIQKYNETAKRPIPELTGDLAKQFSDRATQIAQMPEGRQKQIELFGLKNDLLNLVPSSTTDKAIAVWKAGLLTSLRTHERNIVGNSIMLGSEVAKNVPGSFADRLMSLRTGQRTMTNTLNGLGEFGSKKTRQEIMDLVKLGFDPNQDITKFDMQNHITWADTPVQQMLKKYTDAVFRPLGAEDKAFFNSKFANSLYDQAGAAAINAGKKGDKAFIKNLVDNPTESMLVNATKDANYATFHDKNALGSFAANAKNFLASQKGWKGEVGKAVSEIAAPFTGVPSSIVGKTVSYSPVGLIKGMYDVGKVMAKNVPDLQRQAAQEIGRGVMGTGLFGIGAYLASKGLMTGQPKDKKEADL
ncbi:MAG: hypothetical protein Q8910_01645, partial [Bacteroidota bacterium]|nr:hypothetical protein [Bacteroidota bacterium]